MWCARRCGELMETRTLIGGYSRLHNQRAKEVFQVSSRDVMMCSARGGRYKCSRSIQGGWGAAVHLQKLHNERNSTATRCPKLFLAHSLHERINRFFIPRSLLCLGLPLYFLSLRSHVNGSDKSSRDEEGRSVRGSELRCGQLGLS